MALQAESRLLAQVKLLPKLSLPDDLADFCDPDNSHSHAESENESCLSKLSYDSLTGVLQVPVTVHVVGQANKLQLIVDAVITTTDLVLSPNPINFGFAEIHETVVTRLLITNNSLLPQNFGIVELPEVSVRLTHMIIYFFFLENVQTVKIKFLLNNNRDF